ncbi:MAG: PD-(D/E)XK nuclease family protein [Pseudomonadota bacterium]
MDAIATHHAAVALWRGCTARLLELVGRHGAHPARTVVLLPYAQLMPVARRFWAERVPSGFAPRFETTLSFSRGLGFAPGEHDISFGMADDLLLARGWLEQAGLGGRADALAGRLVELAWQLAPLAAARPPAQRAQWAAEARGHAAAGLEAGVLQLEAALARIAVEWAAASSYATDALLAPALLESLDLLVILQGFQAEPMTQALVDVLGDKAAVLPLAKEARLGTVLLHAASDAADEAERAAACVARHLDAGRAPVGLVATDRVLTRRIRALLGERGVRIRDETGWKLSTTRAAAQVVAVLRACAWDAGSDDVIDWLKHAPAVPPARVLALERRVRRSGQRRWAALQPQDWDGSEPVQQLAQQVAQWRERMGESRPLAQWLAGLQALLVDAGQWQRLQNDSAGERVIESLRLDAAADGDASGAMRQAGRRLPLQEFTHWVNEVLEAESFVPEHTGDEEVVILPFSQVLGRALAALVLPGCDEMRLPASPEPPGPWTSAQRRGLGLPSREALEAVQRSMWRQALQVPHCDLLWRTSDSNGEPLLPSPLVQLLQLRGGARAADDPRRPRWLGPKPSARPMPVATLLPVSQLSASAYDDLRRCPYRFFAMRQLGLKEAQELDGELGKRDFGTWLHAALSGFHERLRETGEPPGAGRTRLMDEAARDALQAERIDESEFLPFGAGWPGVRDAYLAWFARHEAVGAAFAHAESDHEVELGGVKLMGRIDRIDTAADGSAWVMDYKTESLQATRERMKQPLEDTQLAFYAALLGQDQLQAAYLNISERGEVTAVVHAQVMEARVLMLDAIRGELRRIAEGVPLPALGEGRSCEFCAARGVCRRDFWSE